MAKHALKGMKKIRMRSIKKDIKNKEKKRVEAKKAKQRHEKANDGSLPTENIKSEAELKADALNSECPETKLRNQYFFGGYDNLTKKQRRALEHADYKASTIYGHPNESILLVGEGNLSYAKSLVQYPFVHTDKSLSHQHHVQPFRNLTNPEESTKKSRRRKARKDKEEGADSDSGDEKKRNIHMVREVVATCYDGKATLVQKYSDAKQNIKDFQAASYHSGEITKEKAHKDGPMLSKNNEETEGPKVTHELKAKVILSVDCRKLSEIRDGVFLNRFDKIIFQFPHTGSGEKDRSKNISENQDLLIDFFREAMPCLKSLKSEIHVTLKKGDPYVDWKIAECCKKGTENRLQIKTAFDFEPKVFRGYTHRRTLGFKEGLSMGGNEEINKSGAKTYVFSWNRDLMEVDGEDDDDESSEE